MSATKIDGRMYPSGHDNDGVHAVMACLQDWFQAMEENRSHLYQPDPDFYKTWDEEQLNTLVMEIDKDIDQEVTRSPGTSTKSTAGPGFSRLAVPQRLALAQQLHSIVKQFDGTFPS